ncbi:dodecin family protein [Mariniflexile sp. HMF6888]|uniref:dodecin family protein n=1 Tax=Mariniflexile sp. HMF6888 TaxID=3373086 RepID=UPI00379FF5E0
MGVLKVIEILGNSQINFEDAIKNIVAEASKSVKGIKSVYVKDMQVCVKENQITEYRVNAKVTFSVQD